MQASRWIPFSAAALAAGCALALSGCNGGADADAASAPVNVQAAWVVMGEGSHAIARVVTSYALPAGAPAGASVCPQIVVDGRLGRMALRVGAGTVAQRATASDPADSKPSEFPVSVCETQLPDGASQVTVADRSLPLPKAQPQRVLLVGDTGCRMKRANNAWQPCSDPAGWPFAAIVATAAGMAPDLVLHLGDYHYRENACPPDVAGCQGSPWGYGWDAWQADFFKPAAPLLASAPWIMLRGNHEECARAGQGWFRFLDPRAYSEKSSCNLAANDNVGNYSDPYAVALGSDTQVVVFDSSKTGSSALKPTDLQFGIYQRQFQAAAALAAQPGVTTNILAIHHPVLAFAPIAGSMPAPGNPALQSAMSSLYQQAYYPPGIQMALHGHVHNFQALNFASGQPGTLLAGNGGDNLDVALPDPLPANALPAPGAIIDRITHHASFGFAMMERRAAPATGWNFKIYTTDGKLMTTCQQSGRTLACDKTGFIAP